MGGDGTVPEAVNETSFLNFTLDCFTVPSIEAVVGESSYSNRSCRTILPCWMAQCEYTRIEWQTWQAKCPRRKKQAEVRGGCDGPT